MNDSPTKILGTEDAWENGELGTDEKFARVSDLNINDGVDEALELQMISIRLPKSLIEDFKMIAELNGMSYQPLMRQIMKRFADSEKKRIIGNLIDEQNKAKAIAEDTNGDDSNHPIVASM